MRIFKLAWYFWFWSYVRLGLGFYYRVIRLSGTQNIPKGVPIIFASNHENALIDPILKTTRLPMMIHYLVRADVFKKPIIRWYLNSLNLMPVYRLSDGVNSVKANEEIFKNCFDVFKKGEHLILYPEGTHDSRRVARVAKKGISRIALGAMNELDGPDELYIVPVGMNYSAHRTFRSSVHIVFGEPIKVEKKPATAENIDDLKTRYEKEVCKYHVSLDKDKYEILDKVFFHDLSPKAVLEPIEINLAAKKAAKKLTPEIEMRVAELGEAVEKQGLMFPFECKKHYGLNGLLAIFLLPLAALGALLHSPTILIGRYIMKGIKDKVFTDTIFFGVGLLMVPISWLILGVSAWLITEDPFAGFVCVVISGFSLIILRMFVRHWTIFKTNRRLNRSDSLKQKYNEFVELARSIRED